MCKWHKCFSQTLVPLVALIVAVGTVSPESSAKSSPNKQTTLKKLEPRLDNTLIDGPTYNYFVGKGIEAYKQNDFLVAEQFFQIALEDAQSQDLDDLQQAIIMTNLASVERDIQKFAEADKLFKRALEIEKTDTTKNKRALEYTANHYLAMLKKAGRASEAWMLEVSLRDGFKSKKCIDCEESLAKTVKRDNEAFEKAQAKALKQSESTQAASTIPPMNTAINPPTNPMTAPLNTDPSTNPSATNPPSINPQANVPPIAGVDGNGNPPGSDGQPPQIAGGNAPGSPPTNPQNGSGGTAIIQQPYAVPVIYGVPVAQMGSGAAPDACGSVHSPSASPVSPVIPLRQAIPLRTPVGVPMFRTSR